MSHLKDLVFSFLVLPIFCVFGEVLFVLKFTSLSIIRGVLEHVDAVKDSSSVPFYLCSRFIGITDLLLKY